MHTSHDENRIVWIKAGNWFKYLPKLITLLKTYIRSMLWIKWGGLCCWSSFKEQSQFVDCGLWIVLKKSGCTLRNYIIPYTTYPVYKYDHQWSTLSFKCVAWSYKLWYFIEVLSLVLIEFSIFYGSSCNFKLYRTIRSSPQLQISVQLSLTSP